MEKETYTVSQINAYINKKLKFDSNLKNILIKGEISNYKEYPSGHSYFTLKDEKSKIDAVMFKGNKDRFLKFKPENGMKVIIKGKIEVYEKNGNYQLYATKMTEDGEGNLHLAFEQLKKELSRKGLFDDSHKKEIPKYPKRIGVVTAQTGAAIRDIITTIKKRYPICEILIFPTLVQGDLAAPQIVKQINHAQISDIDTLIVGRGGGSIEDLWPFNEEIVAYAIYNCKVPVISAVGHEIDFTISDFVADKRAPTPTGAAMIAVPDINSVKNNVIQLSNRLIKNMNNEIVQNKTKLKHISKKQIFKNPESIYEIKSMSLDNLVSKLNYVSKSIIKDNKTKLSNLENSIIMKNPIEITKSKREACLRNIEKLEILNPLLTLKRGYTLAKSNDKVVSSAKDVKKGDKLDVEFNDGTVNTKVI
ncbi:exodeoxyribonuclease VII large subunit [Methanobrevibacter sp.]|uniref:exodeoxyribonuclease VII large subunit n=1 Tax=Methanobrevibacter sp. TaxID=66852 RepID=UPI0026DF07D7|nr:exodeoxyribonuclease VII large subunit [Methanobrevibacter sp.]MDO5823700.1 exodeoxyribonuclease VII large subunit [Methanobrevibacter sp.]